MSAAPDIRRATPADASVLAELGATTFVETFAHLYSREDLADFLASAHSPAYYERALAEPGAAFWLAGHAGSPPLGYAVAGPCKLPVPALEPAAGEIRRLYVRAAGQGHGLGSRMLVIALDWLVAQRHAPLYVGVWSGNLGAQRLYERFGFAKVGEYEFSVGRQLDREFILKRADP
jgi:ribosomal protein S18 acetylase RimI-like enzyme